MPSRVGYGFLLLTVAVLIAQCTRPISPVPNTLQLSADLYYDKVHGAWQATMVANHTGLVHEGIYLDEPGPGDAIDLILLDQWSTDDDTMIEWVNLHIMETYGLDPSYEQIRLEWIDHLNHDLWVSTGKARELMGQGIIPPQTGDPALNPDGAWSIDAQLETEVFGLIAPGMPHIAATRARRFAQITNRGPAVDASAFYAALYAQAFFENDVPTLIRNTQRLLPDQQELNTIVDNVFVWYSQYPDDWRETRREIRDSYDTDSMWWASRVNFAATIMALLYGEGDLMRTLTIACLAGWDADNNATTSAGLIGIMDGYAHLPLAIRNASDVYYNEDVTGNLPEFEAVTEIARRTAKLGESQIRAADGDITETYYLINTTNAHGN